MLHEFALGAAASAGAVTSGAIQFTDLGLDPVVFRIGFFALRWYSLAYIAGIILGWWYLSKLLKQPGAPMAQRHADDFIFYGTLGIIIGGRLGYVAFYKPEILANPLDVLKLWEGGMSFHGGLIGLSLAVIYFAWRNKLPLPRQFRERRALGPSHHPALGHCFPWHRRWHSSPPESALRGGA